MALQLFTNNASTTLAASITSGSTAVSVVGGTGALFPAPTGGQWCICTIMHIVSSVVTAFEIVKVTARSTDTLTIVRAQEGTSAAAWVAGDTIALLVTAGDLAHMIQPDDLLPYAPIASPIFTGNPRSVTPLTADSSVAIATTAFVKAQGYATLASPSFTGTPIAPTPAVGDNDTSIATTAFVKAQTYDTVADVNAKDAATLASAETYAAAQASAALTSAESYTDTRVRKGINAAVANAPGTTVTFSPAFPTACDSVVVCAYGQNATVSVLTSSRLNFTMINGANGLNSWIAYGH